MATDNSAPRNSVIVVVAFVTVLLLVGLKFALDSYFITMTEETAHSKLVSPEQLIQHREAEKKALTSGSMSIESAMAELTRRGRENLNANGVDLAPRQTDDTGALTGWAKMPRALPPVPAAPAAPVAPSATGTTAEAPHAPALPASAAPAAPAPTAAHH